MHYNTRGDGMEGRAPARGRKSAKFGFPSYRVACALLIPDRYPRRSREERWSDAENAVLT